MRSRPTCRYVDILETNFLSVWLWAANWRKHNLQNRSFNHSVYEYYSLYLIFHFIHSLCLFEQAQIMEMRRKAAMTGMANFDDLDEDFSD